MKSFFLTFFLKMNSFFRTSFLFLLTFIEVFGHVHFNGFFKFFGFINYPQVSSAISKIDNKSRLQCSSECLKDESCYYFDFCKTGNSSTCYIYYSNGAYTSAVVSGACKRYELVSVILLSIFT